MKKNDEPPEQPEATSSGPPAWPIDGGFAALGLAEPLLRALAELGYESPTPIQCATIPSLLAGRDLLGQAQTGTGKTAAFGLPMLQRIDSGTRAVQGLVLTPTRELALQVAEALHGYGRHLTRVAVVPVYGGQPLMAQQRHLERGAHIVVGTPGRIMDHMRRGTLSLERLRTVVLDEADEMLRMGFLEDVEWILKQAPSPAAGRQTALFSATLPPRVRRIAKEHLSDPISPELDRPSVTLPGIEQRYLVVTPGQKLEALSRVLESEATDAVLVFTRTKVAAAEVADRLAGRGYPVAALHGDMTQRERERVIEQLRDGRLELVIATDVAARGLDVERIRHVISYDVPGGAEVYVHRIGRTGRAGRTGTAILFVTPHERRLIHEIERYTGRRVEPMKLPSASDVAARRKELLKDELRRAVAGEDLELHLALVEELVEEGLDAAELAAAGAWLAQKERPITAEVALESLELPSGSPPPRSERGRTERRNVAVERREERSPERGTRRVRPASPPAATALTVPKEPAVPVAETTPAANGRTGPEPRERKEAAPREREEAPKAEPARTSRDPRGDSRRDAGRADAGRAGAGRADAMVHLLLDIGRDGGLRPADVVGAIANLVGMPGQDIGAIDIHDRFALVEVPAHYQQQVIDKLSGATIRGREVRIRVADHREQRRGRRTEPGVKGRAGAVRRRPTPPPRKRR